MFSKHNIFEKQPNSHNTKLNKSISYEKRKVLKKYLVNPKINPQPGTENLRRGEKTVAMIDNRHLKLLVLHNCRAILQQKLEHNMCSV